VNAKKLFLSLIPWLLFSVVIHRGGADLAGVAALLAATLGGVLVIKNAATGVKIIDVAGVVTFAGLALACYAGGSAVAGWVADYGRGAATFALAVIMLGSALTVPFTEQYARESVPRQYWDSPVFRSVNRRISALWGALILVMACGHVLAGHLDPVTGTSSSGGPVNLVLNWAVPVVLVLIGIKATSRIADAATSRTQTQTTSSSHQ
jgi:hypothetical protein